jgi:hypothetical protein
LTGCQQASGSKSTKPGVEQVVSGAIDAYIFGYPLVTMDMTRKFVTNLCDGRRQP